MGEDTAHAFVFQMLEQSSYDWLGCHLQLLQLKVLDTSDESIVEQWLQVPHYFRTRMHGAFDYQLSAWL
jgi:hypothetical protein